MLELLTPFPEEADRSTALRRCVFDTRKASFRYLKSRARDRERNKRRAGAIRVFRRPARSCRKVNAQDPIFQSYPAWADCRSSADDKIDGIALATCLRAKVERFVADVWPEPLAPNVVLIIADDMRKDSLPFLPQTLSSIADQGVNFTNAFSTHPLCGPARGSILSGMSGRDSGVMANADGAQMHATDVIGHWMQQAGYRTGLFGKYLHQVSAPSAPPEGWDEWQELLTYEYFGFDLNVNGDVVTFPESAYSTDVLGTSLQRFISRNRNQPFFAVYAPYAGHGPFSASSRHEDSLLNVDPPRGPNFQPENVEGKPAWVRWFKNTLTVPEAQAIEQHRQQLRSLLALDDAVGDVDEALERFGLRDNTVVIFTSDQGILHGEHWSMTKFAAYEEIIRIPLSLRYPLKYPSPQSSDAMVITSDIATTIANLAGVSVPGEREGMNLASMLEGETPPRDHILIESSGGFSTHPNRAIRTDRWKLIASWRRANPENLFYELYDLQNDPFELVNLYRDPAHAMTSSWLREQLDLELPPTQP